MRKFLPVSIGVRFSKLVIVDLMLPREKVNGHATYNVRAVCDCGKEKVVNKYKLRSGHTRSCGCIGLESSINNLPKPMHGHARLNRKSPTYGIWQSMINRCYQEKSNGYARYGGSGITVCDRWRHDFVAFLNDMGERPNGFTLDRIKNDVGYEPSNCRWASWRQQEGNRTNNVHVVLNGEKMITAEAARRFGMADYHFRRNAKKHGGYQKFVDFLLETRSTPTSLALTPSEAL